MGRIIQRFGIDVRWFAFFPLMTFVAALGYSAWMLGDVPFGNDFIIRLVSGAGFMFAAALISSPVTASTAAFCWAIVWFVLQRLWVPELPRAFMAGAFAGLGTIMPVVYMFSGDSIHYEAYQRNLIIPLLWCVPSSGAFSAVVIFGYGILKAAAHKTRS
ncbi:hypothetical protein ACFQFQ_13745 [Sulfitobacter porphyrae]|uniref:Uncharacterized protein n=1 Tax=Sulfitobacter porphyrae TaxID=1246864 RepID=A0ABW2B4Z3_9RHOB